MEKFRRLSTMISLALLTSAAAQETASKIFPYAYHMKDLPNGLRVIVIPTDYPNIVSLQIPVQTGSRNEVEPGKSGFAHFFEHMMFRGTEQFPPEKYNALIKNAGANQNAFTTDDFTNYHITFSKEDLETILRLEADRFQHLKYSLEAFKTESRAVLGEYNKNYANPVQKLIEVQRDAAFLRHTYKHTTMGFLRDIEDMPNQFEYSLAFFDRYYRPENTCIILAGDLNAETAMALVEKYWSGWQRGSYAAAIPQEPPPYGPIYQHVAWQTPTLPWITVAFRGPAFSETEKDMPAMDIIQSYAFSSSAPLYQKLVIREQKVDQFFPYFPDRKDPYLLTAAARVKDVNDIWYVRDEILKAFAQLRSQKPSAQRLAEIKGNLKYSFANGLDNSEAIARALVGNVALTRDPETLNRVYRLYDALTGEEVQMMANKYFVDQGLVVISLAQGDLPEMANPTGSVDALAQAEAASAPKLESVLLPSDSPIINFRILFNAGSAHDPPGKEGLASLTAAMLAHGSSKELKYEEIQKALFPMAASFGSQVDKEMTVFTGMTHRDNLNAYYEIVAPQLLNPAWDEDDFKRVKTNLINAIKVDLRENNEEELGKEVLYEMIYRDHPYGHLNMGHLQAVEKLTLAEVQEFYRRHYTRANLVLGLAGNYAPEFLQKMSRDFGALPEGTKSGLVLAAPPNSAGLEAEIIQKETRATAISFGFPLGLNRAHPDFAALYLVASYFGEHRSSNSYLYKRMREIRGMNYGDYAYVEYFPRGMFQFQPDPNLARQQQIFQVWIRPVAPEQAQFAIRIAMFELNRLITNGLSQENFEATRDFLLKYVNILTKTQDSQLGYALDSRYYGLGEFTKTLAAQLGKLKRAEVNRVIKKYLQDRQVKFAIITKDAQGLREALLKNATSPITYDADKPAEILAEDKIIQDYRLDFRPEMVRIRPVAEVFE